MLKIDILRSRLRGLVRESGLRVELCMFKPQHRQYAQVFGSPLDLFRDALSQLEPLSYKQRRTQARARASKRFARKQLRLLKQDGPKITREMRLEHFRASQPRPLTYRQRKIPAEILAKRMAKFPAMQKPARPPRKYRPKIFRNSSQRWLERSRASPERRQPKDSSKQTLEQDSPILVTRPNRLKSSRERSDEDVTTVKIEGSEFNPALVRDACTCSKCVDPSSTQKNFQTPEIPTDIRVKKLEILRNGDIRIKWKNDIPRFGKNHFSVYSAGSFSVGETRRGFVHSEAPINTMVKDHTLVGIPKLWDVTTIKEELEYINFQDYMTSDKSLWRALSLLLSHGLLIIRGVPESEKSVEDIALRIGNIRDTLYGRTWDVKSVPDAKNVAYTAQFLGLHMDLLYMADPPGFQLLHCLKSTAQGGSSLFSDAFSAAFKLTEKNLNMLSQNYVAYQYQNAGEHYYHTHQVIEKSPASPVRNVNYSPPFQANYLLPRVGNPQRATGFLRAFRAFTAKVEAEEQVLEYRLQEGECVIFNNRRVLHGRKQFDALGGERWLKGTYVDSDVVRSRFRVLKKTFHHELSTKEGEARFVFEMKAKAVGFGTLPFVDKQLRRRQRRQRQKIRSVKY